MAYTASELAQLRQAILDLSTGQRVTSVTHNGRTVQYAPADLDKLRSIYNQAAAEVAAAQGQGRSRTRRVITSKGLT